MQVKVFKSYSHDTFEREINEWINNGEGGTIQTKEFFVTNESMPSFICIVTWEPAYEDES